MAGAANCFKHGTVLVSANFQHKQQPPRNNFVANVAAGNRSGMPMSEYSKATKRRGTITCAGRDISDFIGGDLARLDLGQGLWDVEEHKSLAIYSPHEEGRYLNRLTDQGYYFLDLSPRGLGDLETTLTKVHPVC